MKFSYKYVEEILTDFLQILRVIIADFIWIIVDLLRGVMKEIIQNMKMCRKGARDPVDLWHCADQGVEKVI